MKRVGSINLGWSGQCGGEGMLFVRKAMNVHASFFWFQANFSS